MFKITRWVDSSKRADWTVLGVDENDGGGEEEHSFDGFDGYVHDSD